MAKPFHVIVAHDLNRGIGIDNKIPWHLPVDMAYFKKTTTTATAGKKNAVIMGRKTWDSIPEKFRPLPDRINIVLSKSVTEVDGALVAHSFDNALQQCEQVPEVQKKPRQVRQKKTFTTDAPVVQPKKVCFSFFLILSVFYSF